MYNHYKTLGQISSLVDTKSDYKPPVIDYGDTTTDPSFYEPLQSMIANMRNSATAGVGVYDFDDGNKVPNDVSIPIGRKPGMTQEEISSIHTKLNQNIKQTVQNTEIYQKELEESKKQLKQSFDMLVNSDDNKSSDISNNKSSVISN